MGDAFDSTAFATPHQCVWTHLCEAPSNDDASVWALSRCLECDLVRLTDIPTVDVAYPREYYGGGEKKFVPGIEAISHIRPALMSRAIRFCEKKARTEDRQPRVLDVGCGRGYLLHDLAARGWSCAGIDIPGSPLPRDAGARNLDCRLGDACKLPWANGLFDLVVINHVLEHVHDPWAACREAARVLRDRGLLYVGVPNYGSFQSRLFGPQWFPLELPRHIYHFSSTSLERLLTETGFSAHYWATRSFRQGVFAWTQSALNILDRSTPNRLLGVLKKESPLMCTKSIAHVALAGIIAPAGVIEVCLTSALGSGSVLAVICSKSISSLRISGNTQP
jgi:SAM-dependent methyltransferase